MSDTRRRFTPEFRAEAMMSVTDTGRPVAHVAAEIGVGAQLLGRWVLQATKIPTARLMRRWTSPSAPSWSGCGKRTPTCGWIGRS